MSQRSVFMPTIFLGILIFGMSLCISTAAFAAEDGSVFVSFQKADAQGQFLVSFGFAYLAGLFTSLTGCVYPLIPITVTLFGAKEGGIRKTKAVFLALCFLSGIVLMYTTFGAFASLAGKQFGSWLSSPFLMVPVLLVLVCMALSLWGIFDIQLPPRVHSVLVGIGGKGYGGAFLMGLVAGMIASPCTGPMLAGLLSIVATKGSLLYGVSLLFLYSLGLGTLFFVVAVFSMILPRPGSWMQSVKSILGMSMIAVAFYFLRSLVPGIQRYGERTLMFLMLSLLCILMGIWMGGIHLSFRRTRSNSVRKAIGILSICTGIFGVIEWYFAPAKLDWFYESSALHQARKDVRPVLIDFSASWCFSCVKMDAETFSSTAVQEELGRFVLWRVDCSFSCKIERNQYGVAVLPTMILLDSHGKMITKVEGFVSKEQLIPQLQKVR